MLNLVTLELGPHVEARRLPLTTTGEDQRIRFDDWLPVLLRASTWNRWTEEEQLIQLAGHLRGREFAEWNLLSPEEKSTYAVARGALRARLDAGSRVLAVQDFRHAIQRDDEPVVDYNYTES